MKQRLEEWLRKDRRAAWLLLAAGVAGMLLIALGNRTASPRTDGENQRSRTEPEIYRESLETRLQALLEEIEGAGKCCVMVTLESGEETIYAMDTQQGGQTSQQHVLVDGPQGKYALAEMVYSPAVQGVAVVCRGADDVRVRAQITEAVRVLTGVTANRISIAKFCE